MTKNNYSLFLTCVLVYLAFYFLTLINMQWLTSLLSRDARLLLLPFAFFFLLKREEKGITFWLFALLVISNLPSDLADMIYIDEYDFYIGTFKTILAIGLTLLTLKEYRSIK